MVILLVATTTDPASINPAHALLAMPGWTPASFLQGVKSFANQQVRLLQHDKGIVEEGHLDVRWEEATGEEVDELIFFSKRTAVPSRPALTVHPAYGPHVRTGKVTGQRGKPTWVAPPHPRVGPWLGLLQDIARSYNLVPEFEITLEGINHRPETNNKLAMFVTIGSTEEYWMRLDAAEIIAQLGWKGLGLGGEPAVGNWNRSIPVLKTFESPPAGRNVGDTS